MLEYHEFVQSKTLSSEEYQNTKHHQYPQDWITARDNYQISLIKNNPSLMKLLDTLYQTNELHQLANKEIRQNIYQRYFATVIYEKYHLDLFKIINASKKITEIKTSNPQPQPINLHQTLLSLPKTTKPHQDLSNLTNYETYLMQNYQTLLDKSHNIPLNIVKDFRNTYSILLSKPSINYLITGTLSLNRNDFIAKYQNLEQLTYLSSKNFKTCDLIVVGFKPSLNLLKIPPSTIILNELQFQIFYYILSNN